MMRMIEMHKIIALILLAANFACGTLVGNPKRPQDGATSTTPQVVQLPTLDMSLPKSVTSLGGEEDGESSGMMLTALPGIQRFFDPDVSKFTLLHAFSDRADRIVKSMNQLIQVLITEETQSTGKFSGKGPEKKLSGSITEISDETFKYQAVVCYEGKLLMHLLFDKDGSHVNATKDFSKNPVGEKLKSNFKSNIDFVKSAEKTIITVKTQGEFPQSRSKLLRYDGSNLVERIQYIQDSKGAFSVSGVNDWFDTHVEGETFEGDSYIVGQMDANGSGESIGYRKASLIACRGGFDESAADLFTALPQRGQSGWCLAQAVESDGPYTNDEKIAAMKRLESVGVTKKATLTTVEFRNGLSCD